MFKTVEQKSEDWEARCCRCGRCCHEKIDFEGRIYYTDIPCQFLDQSTKLCRIYPERNIRHPGCAQLTDKNVGQGFLPADCSYVANVKDYPAPVLPDQGEPDSF